MAVCQQCHCDWCVVLKRVYLFCKCKWVLGLVKVYMLWSFWVCMVAVCLRCGETLCVCDTCVERFGLVEMYNGLLCGCFLGWDGSVSNCGKGADATAGNNTCGGVLVSLFFDFE